MARLRLINLRCNQKEDFIGPDEPYLRLNGINIWGPSTITNGQTIDLTSVVPQSFFGVASLELFDQDVGGPLDPDDFLGAISVSSAQIGSGPQTGSFTGDEANYILTYEVLP